MANRRLLASLSGIFILLILSGIAYGRLITDHQSSDLISDGVHDGLDAPPLFLRAQPLRRVGNLRPDVRIFALHNHRSREPLPHPRLAGGGVGLVSKHRKVHGLANISATYATNFAIVTGCYCGAREFVRVSRASTPDDLLNSAIAGFGSGAILGRLQGGQVGAIRYSIIFGVVGTTVDFATLKLKPSLKSFYESIMGNNDSSLKNGDWLRLPEWSPIQVLDEEALAAKKAREQQLYAQRNVHNLNEEKS